MFSLYDMFYSIIFAILATAYALQEIWIQGDAVNTVCNSNYECRNQGARCINGQCVCLSTHILIDGQCMPKIRPGDSPCSRDEQCRAVWPKTRCLNQICQCSQGSIGIKTRDGVYCLEKYESCPFGGKEAVLRDEKGELASCYVNSRSGYMSGCLGQLSMYDCVRDTKKATFYCCPNKANTCTQPIDLGHYPTPRILQNDKIDEKRFPWYFRHRDLVTGYPKRWYFDHITNTCLSFDYLGAGGSANNFISQQQCQYFCKTTCPRGSPMFQKGPDGDVIQFAQRQQLCNPKIGCSDSQYNCTIVQPGMALCCPNKAFLCGDFGGLPQRKNVLEYDVGIFCGNNTQTLTRYYYSPKSFQCLSFEYKGCGGNHNRFVSQIECQNYCAK